MVYPPPYIRIGFLLIVRDLGFSEGAGGYTGKVALAEFPVDSHNPFLILYYRA
jgi:hypothetical protein